MKFIFPFIFLFLNKSFVSSFCIYFFKVYLALTPQCYIDAEKRKQKNLYFDRR